MRLFNANFGHREDYVQHQRPVPILSLSYKHFEQIVSTSEINHHIFLCQISEQHPLLQTTSYLSRNDVTVMP